MHVAGIFATGFGVAWAAGVWSTARMLARPPRRGYGWALAKGRASDPKELEPSREFESWCVRSRGVDLPVWDVRGDVAGGWTVVLTPGWSDSRVTMLGRVGALARVSGRVVVWDPPGHGESGGRCTLGAREWEDLLAIAERVDEDGRGVVFYGFSMGAGISLAAAARGREGLVRGVIAEAPYRRPETPARNVLRRSGLPWRLTLPTALWLSGIRAGVGWGWHGFDRGMLADEVYRRGIGLLVLVGEEDPVCPLEEASAVAMAGRGRLVVIPGAGHADLWEDAWRVLACVEAVRTELEAWAGCRREGSAGAH